MIRTRKLIFLLYIICMAAIWLPCGAMAATPSAGNCYGGNMPLASGAISINLCLYNKSFFILAQKQEARGKKRSLDICGKWRLVDNNTILKLSNANGFAQTFNVGGKGKLYGDFFAGQNVLPQSVTLKADHFKKMTFAGSGILKKHGNKLILEEAASGIVFENDISAIKNFNEQSPQSKEFLEKGQRLFAEAWLIPEYGTGKILALRHISDKLPGIRTASKNKQKTFCGENANSVWIFEIPGIGMASCRFTKQNNFNNKIKSKKKKNEKKQPDNEALCTGLMEISSSGFRLEATFSTENFNFAVKLKKDDIKRLSTIGAGEFIQNLLGVENWEADNDVLVLKGPGIPDIVLQKYKTNS